MELRKFYVIFNVTEFTWLPQIKYGHAATQLQFTRKEPPRLFSSKNAALQAWNYWKRGKWENYDGEIRLAETRGNLKDCNVIIAEVFLGYTDYTVVHSPEGVK